MLPLVNTTGFGCRYQAAPAAAPTLVLRVRWLYNSLPKDLVTTP
jgi:hypothetical protein